MNVQRVYHDIRPIGPSGSVLVSSSVGSRANTSWKRLSSNALYPDFKITTFGQIFATSGFLAGTGVSLSNQIFTINYNATPSGAELSLSGSGTQQIPPPFNNYNWNDPFFPTGYPGQIRTFTLRASGEFGTDIKTLSLIWLQKQRWGVTTTGIYDSTFISSLQNNAFAKTHSGEFTVNVTGTNHYVFYAFSSSAGPATFIHKASNIKGGFELVGSGINYTNEAGYTEPYSVYKSEYPDLGRVTFILGTG
jgi:hypothetical protein